MTKTGPDYYEALGVSRGATLQEIRTKFRQRATSEHPDKGGNPEIFKLLNEAYAVLADKEKRQRYDTEGHAERSVEEVFLDSFGAGRSNFKPRPREADEKALVNLQERIVNKADTHDSGFAEWMRSREQSNMVVTDKDFMRTALFNASELEAAVAFTGPVQHVFGMRAQDGSTANHVAVEQVVIQKAITHTEVLVKMLAVPVDPPMIDSAHAAGKICLGMTGVGQLEQTGARADNSKVGDTVLVLPEPAKFSRQTPIGTARTLLCCSEDDIFKIPSSVLEELQPEQLCLIPTIVSAYVLLETYTRTLQAGDSVLLNAAHVSSSGAAMLQLCKLLHLKPLCVVPLPGAQQRIAKGEYGSKDAWQDARTSRGQSSGKERARAEEYDRISERLRALGAEEVFPDAVELLHWREQHQRALPKLALDGIAAGESCDQLIHCLQPGEKGAQIVVYGGTATPLDITPSLLTAWGGSVAGFDVGRWVHASPANAVQMMKIMDDIIKLVRANKFVLETMSVKVGLDSVEKGFMCASEMAVGGCQVVLVFPSLEEEREFAKAEQKRAEDEKAAKLAEAEAERCRREEDKKEACERAKRREDWLSLLFSPKSVAASALEDAMTASYEDVSTQASSLLIWLGDDPLSTDETRILLGDGLPTAVVALSWEAHPSSDALRRLDLLSSSILGASWYLRDMNDFEDSDLELLYDIEVLGRSMVLAVEALLKKHRLRWEHVVLGGFGRGAGILLYASMLHLCPAASSIVVFNPVVVFSSFLESKLREQASVKTAVIRLKIFTVWAAEANWVPQKYRGRLEQALRIRRDAYVTPEVLPQGSRSFDRQCVGVLQSILMLSS